MNNIISKARKNNFQLAFPILPGTDSLNDDTLYKINIFGTVIPSISINSDEFHFMGGKVYQESGSMDYGAWNTKFHIDDEFNNYKLIYDWITSINDGKSVFGRLTHEYQITSHLLVFDNWNNLKITFQFDKLWPISLGEIDLSYQDGNEILTCDVGFSYDYFRII